MAVTDLTVTALAGGTYLLSWSTTLTAADVTFYVYRDGVLVKTTALTTYEVGSTDGEGPVYEVFDDAGERPAYAFPNYALLAWYAAPGAGEYVVEQFVAGSWVERARLVDQGERGLPPRVVVVQQGGTFLNGTYTLDYAALSPGAHRWFWTDGTTSAEVADGGGGEWLLRIFDATHSVTYGSNMELPEYPPPGEGGSGFGAAWTVRSGNVGGIPAARVTADRPTGNYFLWRSGVLADSTTHQFRVTPVGVNGNAGATKTFSLLMVRTPDVPAVTYAYDPGTGAVTIAAA